VDSTDRELVERCLAGDELAAERFYGRHAGRVMAYLTRSGFARPDAEDLSQEVFIRALGSLDTFDESRGGLPQWIGAIARNVARRHWARRSPHSAFDPGLADELFATPDGPNPSPEQQEEIDAVRQCVQQLSAELRRVVELRYVDGLTTRGVAAAVGMPEATVRLRLREAQGTLERWLMDKGVSV